MKTLMTVGIILAVLALGVGQEKADLAGLSEKINRQIQTKLPDWKSMSPNISGTLQSGIVVQSWYVPHRNVHVAIAVRESVEAAKKEIRRYLEFRREPQTLTGFGDEAFAPEPNGYQYVLRRGRYVIYISIVLFVEEDPDAQKLTKAEQQARAKAETERILKEFATQFSALELPGT